MINACRLLPQELLVENEKQKKSAYLNSSNSYLEILGVLFFLFISRRLIFVSYVNVVLEWVFEPDLLAAFRSRFPIPH